MMNLQQDYFAALTTVCRQVRETITMIWMNGNCGLNRAVAVEMLKNV